MGDTEFDYSDVNRDFAYIDNPDSRKFTLGSASLGLGFELFYYDMGKGEYFFDIESGIYDLYREGNFDANSIGAGFSYQIRLARHTKLRAKFGFVRHNVSLYFEEFKELNRSRFDALDQPSKEEIGIPEQDNYTEVDNTDKNYNYYYSLEGELQFTKELSGTLSYYASPVELDSLDQTIDSSTIQLGIRYIPWHSSYQSSSNSFNNSYLLNGWSANPWQADYAISIGVNFDDHGHPIINGVGTGFNLNAGVQISDNIWAELDIERGETVNGDDGIAVPDQNFSWGERINSYGVALKYTFMKSQFSHAYLKTGVRRWNLKYHEIDGRFLDDFTFEGDDFYYGVGVDIGLTDRAAFYAQYLIKPINIDDDYVDEKRTTSTITLGARMFFGAGRSWGNLKPKRFVTIQRIPPSNRVLSE